MCHPGSDQDYFVHSTLKYALQLTPFFKHILIEIINSNVYVLDHCILWHFFLFKILILQFISINSIHSALPYHHYLEPEHFHHPR